MDQDHVIELRHIRKEFALCRTDKDRIRTFFHQMQPDIHVALADVNLTVRQGEAVGIIGKNGAGKSTLLKIITGVLFPTSGDVEVRGRIGALLELKAGLLGDMSGRENIYLKTAILGIQEEETRRMEQDIVAFADIGRYIDQPVRTYSSGMKARLGFAINISIRPDILIIDEALSVGDAAFRKKCLEKVNGLIQEGCSALFVSHNEKELKKICTRIVKLEDGRLIDCHD